MPTKRPTGSNKALTALMLCAATLTACQTTSGGSDAGCLFWRAQPPRYSAEADRATINDNKRFNEGMEAICQ